MILLCLIFAGCTITGNVTKETIRIGAIGPFTGDAAVYGQSEKNAIELAVQEINLDGGINGKKLEVIYEDGKCNGMDAATAAQKLINVDKVDIILGGVCSGETLAIAPLAEANEVLVFSSFSSSPDVTNAGDFIFLVCCSELKGFFINSLTGKMGKCFWPTFAILSNGETNINFSTFFWFATYIAIAVPRLLPNSTTSEFW